MSILYLFADTNLFLHYKALNEIDWSVYSDFDQIEIVVCRTVQREIDRLKDGRDGRRSQRARKAASTIREIALNGPQEQKPAGPRVVLNVYDAMRPKQDLEDSLDYGQNDDQIIGYLEQFRSDHPEADARLLTGDSGPILTASNLGIPYAMLDENWRLLPEPDDRDRKIRELSQKVAELAAQEPRFQILCDQQRDDGSGHAKVAYNVFLPLEPSEQNQLLRQLEDRHPPTVTNRARVPALAIMQYEAVDHPQWITKCQEIMAELHADIQQDHFPEIIFRVVNIGTRPATNARIDIQVKGHFGITLPLADLKERLLYRRKLPPPPPVQPKPALYGGVSSVRRMPDLLGTLLPRLNPMPPRHDNEAFYYHNAPTNDTPVTSISWTCDRWRHAMVPKAFTVRVVPVVSDAEVTGEIICTVHADNLSKPTTFKLVVTLSPEQQSALPLAREWFTRSAVITEQKVE